MTREEAIKILKSIKEEYDCPYDIEALDMAISLLEKSSQYYNGGWILADAGNIPKDKVIYKLYDGRMGVGVLFTYEFFHYDEPTVCARDDYGDHPSVIKWAPLPYQLMEDSK